MMNRFIAFLAIAMFLCVPLASSAGTTAYAIGPAPTASSTPSAVIDLNKATPEQKEKFYQDPKLKVAKLPLPAGFSIADFFKYNNEKEALVLSGPPRIQLAKSSYAGDFNGVSFQLTIDDKSDMVAAGDQSFKNVPKGSKVSWDGKFLSLILPEQADARGKKTQKALQLKGDGTAKVESDGKTVSLSGADIRMVYGEKGKEMSTITGKKATATLDTSNGRIVGDSGVQVRDNRFGVFTFQERSAALTLSDAEAKMEGKFLFDTKDNRHLEVGQTGSVGHYYPGKQEFMFDKKGLVIDRDLGIKGMQSDDGKPFYVGLKKGLESELRGKNAILIDSGMVTTPKKGAGKLTPNQRDALAKDIIDSSVLPDELKNKLSKLVDDSKGKSEVEKKALREKLKVEILKSVEDNPKLIVYLFQLDAFSKVSDKMKEELKKGTDPVSAFNKLSAEDQKTIKGVSPSIESILKEKFPQNQAAASGERAIVKLFGDVSGAYQSESKSWVDFESALKVSASNPTARALSIELTGSDGKVARIDGKGVHLLNDKVKIGALEWTKWSASSKPATPSPVVRAPKTSPESDEYKWNVRNYKSYGREAVSIVEDNEALKDFRDIFTPDGKPDVEKIKALQAKLNEGRDEGEKLTVDGKLGQNTLEALQEVDASSADPSFKTSPAEPYIAQDKQDQKAQKSSPRTPSETLLAARVREMLAKEESGEITTEQYNDFINSLESSHPGLDINIDTGEINKFPGRPSPSAQAREKLGGSLLAELYLSNPKNRADIAAAAAIAEKIRTNPKS